MPQNGGKNAKKTSSSTTSKRHFTVVIGNKEHGLYVSSSPSSAARKAVSKLCATDKKRKVEFQIREITQGSKKKTYGPYLGEIEKLKEPIELKGRVIKYKPVAKLLGKKTKTGGAKKKGSILVVEAKDGKVSKKYITKKQADKHMKPRHKRLDKGMKPLHKSMDKSMKKLHKSMRGGEDYSCFTSIPRTNCTFTITKSEDGNKYNLIFLYNNPSNKKFIELTGDDKTNFYVSLIHNNLVNYLNENTHNFYYELSSIITAHNYYQRIINLLLGYFVHGPHSSIIIKDSVVRNNEQYISKEELFKRITNTLNS
jgi:hypothetical protein